MAQTNGQVAGARLKALPRPLGLVLAALSSSFFFAFLLFFLLLLVGVLFGLPIF